MEAELKTKKKQINDLFKKKQELLREAETESVGSVGMSNLTVTADVEANTLGKP